MTQLIPEKILEIIDDHDRAEKKQRNKIGFIYLCLCLAIIGVAAYTFISTFSINVVTIIIMLFGVFMIVIFKSYLDSWSGIILSSDHILSILDKTKDYPEINLLVIGEKNGATNSKIFWHNAQLSQDEALQKVNRQLHSFDLIDEQIYLAK